MDSDELIPVSMDEQVEEMEDLDISYRVFHPAAIIRDKSSQRNINVPFSSLTAKYRNLLSAIIVTADLMEDFDIDYNLYQYKPKALSEAIYGTTEFWSDILILNRCFSITDFTFGNNIKIYDPDDFKEYLNEILSLEDLF